MPLRRVSRLSLLAASLPLLLSAGCRSASVETTVTNAGSTELHSIEVDYPSASFGIPHLAPGESAHHRIHLQDSGPLKVQFLDNAEKLHSGQGPYAAEGQRGTLAITLDGTGKNTWAANLHPTASIPKQ